MRVLFVGDVMLGRLVNEVLKHKPPEYPWGDTLPLFKEADFRVCNLECVISDWGQPWSLTPKTFHFRSDSKNIEVLKAASIDAVMLANNHTLDYEDEAMFEMFTTLDKAGITWAGAGRNSKEASSLAIREVQGKKVGLLAFTDNEPRWEALESRPGVFYLPVEVKEKRAKKLFQTVKKAKENADFLIVSAHWGPNWGYHPPGSHISFAKKLIESGADIIFGHSSHVFRGLEFYRGGVILYSAGDFIDDYAVSEIERNDQSFIFMVEIEGKTITHLTLFPTVIRNFQARKAVGSEAEEIALKMKKLCQELRTKADWNGKYLKVWDSLPLA